MISHDVPDRPWQKVAADLFTVKGKDNLVTVNYYSNYSELEKLDDTNAVTVIRKLKAHFAH